MISLLFRSGEVGRKIDSASYASNHIDAPFYPLYVWAVLRASLGLNVTTTKSATSASIPNEDLRKNSRLLGVLNGVSNQRMPANHADVFVFNPF